MKNIVITSLLACFFIANTSYARDYMGMETVIIKESDIEAEITAVESEESTQIIRILLGTEHTAGQFSMFSVEFPSKDITIPVHSHKWHDEAFYVIKGKFEVMNGDMEIQIVEENTAVFTPRGEEHSWKSLEDSGKIIVVYTPGGWEHFYNAVKNLTEEQKHDKAFMQEFMTSYDEIF